MGSREPVETEESKGFRLPGVGWKRSLLSVLIGNLIYFGIFDYLPEDLQQKPFSYDLGLALDFWICVMVYGAIRILFPRL